jgi:uncharacterized repeat protein (TIGR03847 family)
MTRRIFSFDPPDRFVCGAVGEPGQRTFFLQASKGENVVSVALEKAQVAVLAERLALLLVALRGQGTQISADAELLTGADLAGAQVEALSEPVVEQFRVGALTLAWDEDRERVVIEAREMTAADLQDEEGDVASGEQAGEELEEAGSPFDSLADGPDLVRVLLEPTEARAFVSGAVAVVQAGRLPCPLCGAPLDPSGHFCPRRNGYTH